jgi:hypothetical protein
LNFLAFGPQLKLPRTCMHVDKILEKLVHAMGEN